MAPAFWRRKKPTSGWADKSSKKHKDTFEQYRDCIYDITDVLEKEGYSRAECRYKEIMATILLLILDSLHVIRSTLCFSIGLNVYLLLKLLLMKL